MDSPLQPVPDGVLLDVWVVPGAARTEIKGEHDGALRVRVAAPASRGAANAALISHLERRLGRRVELVSGASGRRKQLHIGWTDLTSIAARLGLEPD